MRRKRNKPPDLSRLAVPEHREGFWDDVLADLAAVDAAQVHGGSSADGQIVELRQPEEPSRRVSPWLVASAAAAFVLVLGGAAVLLTRPATESDPVASPDVSDTAVALDGSEVTTTLLVLPSAPWSAPALRLGEVPEELATAWSGAENQLWCTALAPTLRSSTPVEPRQANLDAGGWAVAWDAPEGPGQNSDGSECPDCGRSSFGVAGTNVPYIPEAAAMPEPSVSWADGSFVALGIESVGSGSGDESATRHVATLVVEGQGCVYEVWSHRGRDHLVRLIDSLRVVNGLTAEAVRLRGPSDAPDVSIEGPPPWNRPSPDGVDAFVSDRIAELDLTGDQLYIADLGDAAGASIRIWQDGVAWDSDAGPGHDTELQPCTNCGRGVAGLGWQPVTERAEGEVSPPYRIEWADGSYAEYGSMVADHAIPRDRVLFIDAETGEDTVDALWATVHVVGADQQVVVWTHLGEEHLLFLIDQLRWIASGG